MVDLLEAIQRADDKVASPPYSKYRLSRAARLPLKLPNGWRISFKSTVRAIRVREAMLILFVDDQSGEITVEWDDFERKPIKRAWVEKEAEEIPSLPSLPPLSLLYREVEQVYRQIQIETTEPVWDEDEEGKIGLYWRLGLLEGIRRYVTKFRGRQDGTFERSDLERQVEKRVPRSKSVTRDWTLGRARFRRESGNVTIKLKGLDKPGGQVLASLYDVPPSQEYLRSQWVVWCCMAHAAEFLEGLGYGEIGPHNIRVEFLASDITVTGAAFNTVNDVPVISFLRGEGWSEAPSLVLHEVAHALWFLLYARPPKHIEHDKHKREQEGIEEGFADYFAAALLSEDNHPIEIGSDLNVPHLSAFKLPRPVNGQPFELPASANLATLDEHLIGRKWANALWDFRGQVGPARADPIVLRAHIMPRLGDDLPDKPMSSYWESLKTTAQGMEVAFDEWNALAERHGI